MALKGSEEVSYSYQQSFGVWPKSRLRKEVEVLSM